VCLEPTELYASIDRQAGRQAWFLFYFCVYLCVCVCVCVYVGVVYVILYMWRMEEEDGALKREDGFLGVRRGRVSGMELNTME